MSAASRFTAMQSAPAGFFGAAARALCLGCAMGENTFVIPTMG